MFRHLITAVMLLSLLPASARASTINWFSGPNGTLTDGTTTVSGSTAITETLSPYQSSKQFTAIPAPGYHFRNYSGTNGFTSVTNNPVSIVGDLNNHDITANFTTVIDQFDVVTHGLPDIVDMKAGMSHTVILKKDGTVVAWGGIDGQSDPALAALTGVTAIGAGPYNTFIVKGGMVQGFGSYGEATTSPIIMPNPPPTSVVAVVSGYTHTVALKSDGTVVSWGIDNLYGQISPLPDFGGHKVTALAAGHYFTLALLDDGTVRGWGENDAGETNVAGLSNVVAIDAKAWHAAAVLKDGTVVCWGSDDKGQNQVPSGLANVKAIASGGHHNVALKMDGTVVSWGDTSHGQDLMPAGINGSVTAIGAGYYHSLAATNVAVVGWGFNISNQCNVPARTYGPITNGTVTCQTNGVYANSVGYGSNSVCTITPSDNEQTFFAVNGAVRAVATGPTSTTLSNIQSFQSITAVFALAPDAPSITAVTVGAGQATVTIAPPANDGGSKILGYTVKTITPVAGVGIDQDAGSAKLVHTVTGLNAETAYTFTATATNIIGTGPASAASKLPQAITVVTPAPNSAAVGSSFTVAATAPGGDVSYSNAGGCSNVGPVFIMDSPTLTCTVMYDQTGSATYGAAPQVSSQTAAAKAEQVISVTSGKGAPASAQFGTSFTVDASAPGGPVSYSSAGGCSNVGALFTMTSSSLPCTVKYDQPGSLNFNAAPEITTQTAAAKADQAIVITAGKAAPVSAPFGGSFTVDATAAGGPITYGSAGGCTNLGAIFTMTSASLPCIVKYDQPGSTNYNASPEITSQTAAGKADQVITITSGKSAPASAPFGATFTVDAGAPGGAVAYSSAGGCSNAGPVFTMTSATLPCTVKYDQAGNDSYASAPEVTSQTAPLKAEQNITVATQAPASAPFGSSFTVAATATGGPVSYGSAGGCSNVGPLFTMTSATLACTAKYDQGGGTNYNPALQVTSQTAASKADQTITITAGKAAPVSAQYGTTFTIDAGAPGGQVSYSSAGGCSNLGATFTMTSATVGCTVKYDQPGGANYNAAPQLTTQTTASKADQTIVITTGKSAPASAPLGATFTVEASSAVGPVSYGSAGGCSNVGGLFTMTSPTLPCTVKYDQAGDANYNAVEVTSQTAASKADQAISITAGKSAPASAPFGASFAVDASATGGAVSYSSAGGCSNVGAIFTMTSATVPCTVKYDQAGNANYNAAPQLTSLTASAKAEQAISITAGKAAPVSAPQGASFTVDASAPGGAVTYSSAGGCTNVGPLFTMTNATLACTVKYDQAGSADYNPAPQLSSQTLAGKAEQSITITSQAPASALYGSSFTVAATAPGGAVSYSSAGGCTNTGATFTMTSGTESCTVRYDQSGSANYNAAPQTTSVTGATAAAPGAPTIGMPTGAVNGQASVPFTAPAFTGGSAITAYTVTANPGNITATGTASPVLVTGLLNGTAYTFTMAASNAAGAGSASAPSAAVTPLANGDLNGDGVVDVRDAMLAMRLSVGLDSSNAAILNRGDVAPLVNNKPKGDGRIDTGDAIVILRKVVGLVNW